MKNLKKFLLGFLAVMLIVPIGIWAVRSVNAGSADSVSVTSIDYNNMTLTIKGKGDKVFYLSDSKQKKWERITGEENNGSVTMDISWVSAGQNYVLSLKGDKSTEPVKVTLPKCNNKFKAKYNKETGAVTYTGIDEDYKGTIQWRVKGSTIWNDTTVSDTSLKDKLDYYVNEMATTTVYFRTAPVNGTSIEDAGERASKEVSFSLAKKTTAPTVSANGGSFIMSVPAGTQYRLVGNTEWSEKVSKATELDLKETAPGAFYSASNTSPSNQAIEVRKAATATAQVSASAILYLNAQQSAEDVGLDSSSVEKTYLSADTLNIYFPVEEEAKNSVYEYAISSDGSEPDSASKWTALSTKTKTENKEKSYYVTKDFSSKDLKEGDTLWLRRKTSGKAGKENFMLASSSYSWQAGAYPAASEDVTGQAKDIIGIKGSTYQTDISLSYAVDANLSEELTKISTINLYKDKEQATAITATLPTEKDYYSIPDTYTQTEDGKKRIYTFQVNAKGITNFFANNKLSIDTKYYLGVVLASGEKIVMNTTLTVLSGTTISGDSQFVKIAGYDKEFTLTLDYGKKKRELCSASIVCGGTNTAEIVNVTDSGDSKQVITFKLQDSYFEEDTADIIVNISYAHESGTLSEALTGIKATLEQPITASSSGGISFTEGACSKDVEFKLTLNSSKQVTGDFGITDIKWGTTSIKENMMVVQDGISISVTLSADKLNTLSAGVNYVEVQVNGNVWCKTTYKITISDAVSAASVASYVYAASTYSNEAVESVAVKGIDYANNQVLLDLNGNKAGLFSTDKKKWYTLGDKKDANGYVVFNISWVSDTRAYTVYFKGIGATAEEEYTQVVFPKKNTAIKVTFAKTSTAEEPVITVLKAEDEMRLQWRKSTSYTWHTASAAEEGKYIIPELESLRMKGGKIIVRTIATDGTDESDTGVRYSKEVSLSIPKRANAPSVKINTAKMNVNTTTSLEYYNTDSQKWVACTKNMSVWDFKEVASKAKGSKTSAGADVTISFRKAATKSAGYSKTFDLVFAGQAKAPEITTTEDDEVVYSETEKKSASKTTTYRKLTFNKADKNNKYQYVVIAGDAEFDESTAKWSTVSKASTVTLKQKDAVPGATVYVRILGTNASAKNANAVLSSAVGSYQIN